MMNNNRSPRPTIYGNEATQAVAATALMLMLAGTMYFSAKLKTLVKEKRKNSAKKSTVVVMTDPGENGNLAELLKKYLRKIENIEHITTFITHGDGSLDGKLADVEFRKQLKEAYELEYPDKPVFPILVHVSQTHLVLIY